ncbi:MAG: C39 family peptidase [Cyanobacteriota bacterium]|nr:C39 family peptidase [Cyanobacteriota bacterium]
MLHSLYRWIGRYSIPWLIGLLVLGLGGMMGSPTTGQSVMAQQSSYQTGLVVWQAAEQGFADWQLAGIEITPEGTLQLDPPTAEWQRDPYPAGGYREGNFYNGGEFWLGEAISPITPTTFGFVGALASWNTTTPAGSWVEVQLRAQIKDGWTKWYSYGVWTSHPSATVQPHSIDEQADEHGNLYTDLLVLKDEIQGSSALQVKVRLFSEQETAIPVLRQAAVATSTIPIQAESGISGNPALWNRSLSLPECSQMVYADGGEVWCSPTSVAMVKAYWQSSQAACEPQVRATVAGVYDWLYDGHGNWAFNVAHATSQGLLGYVARLNSLAAAEPWIAAQVPVVFSFAWQEGELAGAAIPKSDGHLAVLVGFNTQGDPIVHDPAAARDSEVRRTYPRAQLEKLWLGASGGTVYLIYPPQQKVPVFG